MQVFDIQHSFTDPLADFFLGFVEYFKNLSSIFLILSVGDRKKPGELWGIERNQVNCGV